MYIRSCSKPHPKKCQHTEENSFACVPVVYIHVVKLSNGRCNVCQNNNFYVNYCIPSEKKKYCHLCTIFPAKFVSPYFSCLNPKFQHFDTFKLQPCSALCLRGHADVQILKFQRHGRNYSESIFRWFYTLRWKIALSNGIFKIQTPSARSPYFAYTSTFTSMCPLTQACCTPASSPSRIHQHVQHPAYTNRYTTLRIPERTPLCVHQHVHHLCTPARTPSCVHHHVHYIMCRRASKVV